MTISRSNARSLSASATRAGAAILGGRLVQEGGHFFINKIDVTAIFENLVNRNVVIVVAGVEDQQEEQLRACLTCGREYTGSECPHCARIRSRLRG